MVDKISPHKDTAFISSYIPKLLAASIPKPINYYNYNVGECKDLIFGVSLVDYATARGISDGEIPKIVRICIQEIELRGMDAEGIYRVSSILSINTDNTNQVITGIWKTCSCPRGTIFSRNLMNEVNIIPLALKLQHKIERNEAAFAFNPSVDDVYVVSSFLKVV